MFWSRAMQRYFKVFYARLRTSRIYLTVSWLSTLVYVAWVQTFANQATLAESVAMTRALVGL